MKKTLIRFITLVLAVCAVAAMAIPSHAASTGGWYVSTNSNPTTVEEDVAQTYSNAMHHIENNDTSMKLFTDPHEAWNDFIKTRTSNNWFKLRGTEINHTIELPEYMCYNPQYLGVTVQEAFNNRDKYYNLCRQIWTSSTGSGGTIWEWAGTYWQTTAYYDDCTYTAAFGHPSLLCNLDNPNVWKAEDVTHGYFNLTRSDTMYTGTYSEEMKAKIQTWWGTMDAYIAEQNGGTSAPATPAAPATPNTSTGTFVTVDGKDVTWTDAEPFIDANSRTMVPLRAVADAMGLTVSWDAANREASFSNGSKTIYFPIDIVIARTSDGGSITMDTAAVITGDRTYAPVRYLAEFFGYTVGWNADTKTVVIS